MAVLSSIELFPELCGVYLFKNKAGEIIYIGKAKNLKKRVSSYFDNRPKDPKTQLLVSRIHSVEFIATKTENEAFLLENQLIKTHQPKYNIQLKDSKTYPFIAIDKNELFPRIYKTRETDKKGVAYYGPYTSVETVRQILKIAQKYFKLRLCRTKIELEKSQKKPCLFYHIGRCPGFCIGKVETLEYEKNLKLFLQFLSGRYSSLEKELQKKMEEFSSQLEFEKAAELRDLLRAIGEIKQKQKVYFQNELDSDVFGFFESEKHFFISVLQFREGRLLGKRNYKIVQYLEKTTLFYELLSRFYEENDLPEKIYMPIEWEEQEIKEEIKSFLSSFSQKKVEIFFPNSGFGLEMIKMANDNARYEFLMDQKMTQKDLALQKLKEILGLKIEPRRIECYDIATIEGNWSVGACVSFFNGKPDKKNYRHFKIKTVEGVDDYAMIKEILTRRFQLENMAPPDLIVIDGGKGHLSTASYALEEMGIEIPVIALAKKQEEIFIPYRNESIKIEKNNPSLQILTSARDEAHRFANRLHKKLRGETIQTTMLEKIPGIGKEKRKLLLQTFGSLEKIKNASLEDLQKINGISLKTAQKIKKFFEKK